MPNLPIGTITFLFTDIEGSTQLWEQFPEAMRSALARHDALIREAIATNGGVVFKTIGDAFCAAFATAPEALAAALAAQLALHSETWSLPLPLKVRIALHTGATEKRDNDYFGPTLNRLARFLAIGHGGQTLLSDVTQELVRDSLPPRAALQPLGEHRLKDLFRPEIVFQLLYPNLPTEFPPLKSLDNPELPNNLPVQVTSFIGREKEMGEIKDLLGKTRLLTLTGSGGCGKTRLSLQFGAEILEAFPDGVWFVELASLSDPVLVVQSVAQVVGVKEEANKSLTQTLTESLKSKRLLLMLDNCEHLLIACAQLADAILRQCPNVQILASSREGLGIAGELTYQIPSLSLPNPNQPYTPETLSHYEAVRLFLDRAQFHLPAFTVTNRNASALASLCHRLDGIPLALELAAARIRSLSVEEIEARLGQRFRLLTGGNRTALPRQQTLRAAVDWSYDLLAEREKTLLHHLSVFAGGWTLAAAEAICAGDGREEWEVLDLLTSLVDKSLVLYEEREGQGRYHLLATVQQYAREKLRESGEDERMQERHLSYFLWLAEEGEPELKGADQQVWLNRLEEDHDNLRATLAFCKDEAGVRLAGGLWYFWYIRGYHVEGLRHLNAVLALPNSQERTAARALALNGAGGLSTMHLDYPAARAFFEESLSIRQELGDRKAMGITLNNLGLMCFRRGDYAAARAYLEEALPIHRETGNRIMEGMTTGVLGEVFCTEENYAIACFHLEQALAINREIGNLHMESDVLNIFGDVAWRQENWTSAKAYYQQSLDISRKIGFRIGEVQGLSGLGRTATMEGDYTLARSLLLQSLEILRRMKEQWNITSWLDAMALLCVAQGDAEPATRLYGAIAMLRETLHIPVPPGELKIHERKMAELQQVLGEEAFESAYAEGRTLTAAAAVTLAQKIL